ncbi:putative pectinesterase/pectinesterase inhibitor 7 [Camellia lanceoleosa]|nr:putative pectinesterase/pectinesterase inhibitor 7 [Camellia lanceoleosa]
MFSKNGHLGLEMLSQHQKVYESVSGRKLLQTSGGGQVKVNNMVIVNKDGSGNFTTISDAVAAAPNNTVANMGYFMIYVVRGVYEEYILIAKSKQYLMVVGDGINKTIITGNHSVADGWTTFSSATVALKATKTTLYTHSLRQFYRECDSYGTVDFIFGNVAVVFQNSNVYPRLPILGQFNTITAQGRADINQNTGTSIQNCTITAPPDLAANNGTTQTYLGRPWKPYSRTVYMQSFLDYLINPAGWAAWSRTFALDTLYYAEYNNRGLGSSSANRVTWPGYHVINATYAVNFTVSNNRVTWPGYHVINATYAVNFTVSNFI